MDFISVFSREIASRFLTTTIKQEVELFTLLSAAESSASSVEFVRLSAAVCLRDASSFSFSSNSCDFCSSVTSDRKIE